jgi:erythromycin esterase
MDKSLTSAVEELRDNSFVLEGTSDLDPLMERIGDAKYVLLGEASHGTHEYYVWRSRISRRLIEEKGFSFIAVEGDWPDCYAVNRFIKQYPDAGGSAREVMHRFDRWPTWMWGNWETTALVEWLHRYNATQPRERRVGFYGLDVYSLWESLESITRYLEKTDPAALATAREAMACFEPYGRDEQEYARITRVVPTSCEQEVIDMLLEISRKMPLYDSDPEAVFSTEQNAHIAVNAERYYRAMMHSGPESWNIRDTHMADTLERLMQFHGPDARAIVWEHNTHIGDARATDMKRSGYVNVGQLVREKHEDEGVVLVGFGSYKGEVLAARSWGDEPEVMPVPEARDGSWEEMLHEADLTQHLLLLDDWKMDPHRAKQTFDHRAIGVVYNPEFERFANYVPSVLPSRYDAFIFIDETHELHPLHIEPHGHRVPETYPWGI